MVHRKIIRRVRRIFRKPKPIAPSRLPVGTAVGTGIKGGILVTTTGGGVKAVFQDRADQPLDPSRAAAIMRGVGGARPTPPLTPTEVTKIKTAGVLIPSGAVPTSSRQQQLLQRRLKQIRQQKREEFLRAPEVGRRLRKKEVTTLPLSRIERERIQQRLKERKKKIQKQFDPKIKKTLKFIQKGGDKLSESLGDAKRELREVLDPKEKQLRIQSEKQLERFLDEQRQLEKDFNSFNNRFGGKELSQAQFDQATKEQRELMTRQDVLNENSQVFSSEFKKVIKERPENIKAFFRELGKEAITVPFTAGIIVTKVATRPITTVKEALVGIKALPSEFKARPFTVGGTIAGQIVGFRVLGVGPGKLKKIVSEKNINASGSNFVIAKKPIKKTPLLAEIFPKKIKFEISDVKVTNYLKNEFRKRGGDFTKLNKINQNFLIGQIKARIRNRPDLFISQTLRISLRRAKIKNLRSFTRGRLEGRFDQPISFTRISKKVKPDLTKLQQSTLKRLKENAEKDAIRRAIQKGRQKLKASDLLSKSEIDFIQAQLNAIIKADPKRIIPKTRRIAIQRLESIERKLKSQEAIKTAIQKGTKKLKLSDLLSKKEISFVKSQLKVIVRADPKRFTPKSRRIAIKKVKNIESKLRVKRAIKEARKGKALKLSNIEKDLIESRLKVIARTQPERLIPKIRQQALLQVQKPKVKEPVFKVISPKQTRIQKLALERFKKQQRRVSSNLKQVQKQQVEFKTKQFKLSGQLQKQKTKLNKTKQKLKSKQEQIQQVQKQRLAKPLIAKAKLKQKARLKSRLVLVSQIQQQSQSVKQLSKQASRFKLRFRQLQKLKFQQVERQGQLQRQLQRSKKILRTKQILKPKKLIVIPPRFKKVKRRLVKRKKVQAFDVLARPRKKKGAKKIPKLIKINKVPLSRINARNLRNKVLDTSLARTGRIRPIRGKPKRPLLRVPKNFAKQTKRKFRTFRRVKGKKIPLRKGKVIEKSRFLLDTRAEKRSITLSRRVAQLNKQARQPPKAIKTSKPKRKVSQKTLDILARGRKTRLQNLKKRKGG